MKKSGKIVILDAGPAGLAYTMVLYNANKNFFLLKGTKNRGTCKNI